MTDCQKIKEGVFELKDGEVLENYHAPYKGYYIFCHQRSIYYSKRIKPLVESFQIKWNFNFENASHFLLTGQYIKNQSLVSQISFIPGPLDIKNQGGDLHLKKSWDPRKVKTLNYKEPSEYYDYFNREFQKEIEHELEASKMYGLLLSSGYDSNSILLCLSKTPYFKNLITYTHIPKQNAKVISKKNNYLSNEQKAIECILDLLPPLKSRFTNSEHKSTFETMKYLGSELIEPTYGASNLNWIVDIIEIGKSEGVSNFLTGQMGNFTFSWPGINLNTLKGIKTLLHQLKKAVNNKKIFRSISFLKNTHYKNVFTDSSPWLYINPLKSNSYKHSKLNYLGFNSKIRSFNYSSLEDLYNVSFRDFTCSKRVVKFIAGTPEKVFSSAGKEKQLANSFFPKKLIEQFKKNQKGRQGADVTLRTFESKEELINFFLHTNQKTKSLIEVEDIIQHLKKLNASTENDINQMVKNNSIWRITHLIQFANTLKSYDAASVVTPSKTVAKAALVSSKKLL